MFHSLQTLVEHSKVRKMESHHILHFRQEWPKEKFLYSRTICGHFVHEENRSE